MILGDVLVRRLAELGVRRVWGEAVPTSGNAGSVAHVPVREADLAVLLADSDGRIGEVDGRGRLGAALLGDGILHLSSKPGGTAFPRTVTTPEELLNALVDPPGLIVPDTSAVHIDVDLGTPVDDGLAASAEPDRETVLTLDPSLAGLRFMVVAGPGVVRSGGIEGLRTLSRGISAGVVNTWGAKGVERWDSPWHFGTIGLQTRDIELSRLSEADVLIVSGLDPVEVSVEDLGHPVTQVVHPAQLGALTTRWDTRGDAPDGRPPLYESLAAVVTPAYEDDRAPLSAPRAALHLSGALPEGGMAVVDPGLAGFWVGRTFPTSIPNSMCIPATEEPGAAGGFAAAGALVARMEGRAVLAVTDPAGFDAPETGAVLAFAERHEVPVALQVWRDEPAGRDRRWSTADDHVTLLREHLLADSVRVDDVPVRLGDLDPIEGVAGPVSAWG